jgi:hypothetical protein
MRIFDIFAKHDSIQEDQAPKPQPAENQPEDKPANPTDTVTMDVPLLLRIMEYSKEDAQSDMDLHHVVEKLVSLSSTGQPLSMDNYNDVVGGVQEGDAPAEKLIRDVEYDPDQKTEPTSYRLTKHVVSDSNGVPTVRYRIQNAQGNPVGPAFDSKESANSYIRKLDAGDVTEGYGRYWCSTDKRWKERKGPKQSRG